MSAARPTSDALTPSCRFATGGDPWSTASSYFVGRTRRAGALLPHQTLRRLGPSSGLAAPPLFQPERLEGLRQEFALPGRRAEFLACPRFAAPQHQTRRTAGASGGALPPPSSSAVPPLTPPGALAVLPNWRRSCHQGFPPLGLHRRPFTPCPA